MKTLDDILAAVRTDCTTVLAKNPPVEEVDAEDLDLDDIPSAAANKWYKIDDVVVVVVDLQNSTRLGTGKHAASTAAIYRAATGNAVKILHEFEADFIAIQGDGAFGVFWGERRVERAICAGITIKTFSEQTLVPKLESRWENDPDTGFKVGLAAGRVLVKNIGTRNNDDEQEPIWAGKPVNYAMKAAQQAKRHELILTGSVWIAIEDNDYLTISCPCHGGPGGTLWEDVEITKLAHDESEAAGRLLTSMWCVNCGNNYCAHIVAGDTDRDDDGIDNARSVAESAKSVIHRARWGMARDRAARKRGLRGGRRSA